MSNAESLYRLRLAEGFLATKAVLALLGPVGRTHNPAVHWRAALEQGRFRPSQAPAVRSLTEKAELLGPDIHIQTDYGDEAGGRTPWELFDEEDARQALAMAEEAVALAKQIIQEANDA